LSVGTPAMLEFYVKDNGVGIPKDKQKEIFQAFRQAHPGRDSHELGGTGLGLTISKRLVEMMGGQMWLESETSNDQRHPRGTTVSFTLPYKTCAVAFKNKIKQLKKLKSPAPPPTEPTESSLSSSSQSSLSSSSSSSSSPQPSSAPIDKVQPRGETPSRVLVVDDNLVNLKLAVRLVNKMGFQTETARNGQEAVDAVERDRSSGEDQIKLVLMDKEMPVMDGLEATREIRRMELERNDHVPIPIVALTAAAYQEDKDACLDAGCDGYLTKPIKRDALNETLLEHCCFG